MTLNIDISSVSGLGIAGTQLKKRERRVAPYESFQEILQTLNYMGIDRQQKRSSLQGA